MKQVKKSVLLWYAPHEIYQLVTDVEKYPEFLPWCERAQVLSRDAEGLTARLHLATRHPPRLRPGTSVPTSRSDRPRHGPFSLLDGHWRFVALARPGGPRRPRQRLQIEFELRYAFANAVLRRRSAVFDRIANTFVDSFVRRAEQVHGPR
jgi:ribosome-associated toxin RatA of RatAB toxin-antitoxin module